jgi:hypothetical protein
MLLFGLVVSGLVFLLPAIPLATLSAILSVVERSRSPWVCVAAGAAIGLTLSGTLVHVAAYSSLSPWFAIPAALVLLASVFAVTHWRYNRAASRDAGADLCPRCGYNLLGKLEAGCPECGWRRGVA